MEDLPEMNDREYIDYLKKIAKELGWRNIEVGRCFLETKRLQKEEEDKRRKEEKKWQTLSTPIDGENYNRRY